VKCSFSGRNEKFLPGKQYPFLHIGSQREHNKALRQKLNKMIKDFPNKKWAIRRDKVIELPGAPLKGGTAGISPNRAAARGPPTGSATGGGSK